jgi:hypothetical protein
MDRTTGWIMIAALLLVACGRGGEHADADADQGGDRETAGEPECAAEGGARCYYVAPDGDDAGPGAIDRPFRTFRAAMTLAAPGDFIYAREGTYGFDNAMVSGVERDYESYPATSCPEGQVLADEYCFTDTYAMIAIQDFSGWASNTPAYTVASGEEGRPITVRSFPGERPVLDVGAFTQRAVTGYLKAFWIVQGLRSSAAASTWAVGRTRSRPTTSPSSGATSTT